jgi:type IV pilus biogenesis protein CpaD/CtpE
MLLEPVDDSGAITPAELQRTYESHLGEILEDVGISSAIERTSLDRTTVERLIAGEAPELTVREAAEVLALLEEWPDAETVMLELQDTLMLRMSSAVMDVDALSIAVEAELDATAIQQRIERRHPMTLAEYAQIVHAIAEGRPD